MSLNLFSPFYSFLFLVVSTLTSPILYSYFFFSFASLLRSRVSFSGGHPGERRLPTLRNRGEGGNWPLLVLADDGTDRAAHLWISLSRNVDLCEMVPGAARPHQRRDFFFAAFFLAIFFFATFFFATFFFTVFGFGTFLPFLRASERAMAIACFLLFTVPPLPPLPLFSVPFFFEPKWSAPFDGSTYGELVLNSMKAFVEYDKLHEIIAQRDALANPA